MPGGVAQTSTERRIMFSPEIPGRRIGEARPEWEVFLDLARRVRAAGFSGIREERMWSGSFLLVRGVKEAG